MSDNRKTMYERFGRFTPEGDHKKIFDCALIDSVKLDREKKILELKISLPDLISKKCIYSLEDALRDTYGLSLVRILTRYPSEKFTESYLPEIIAETARIGSVVNGFFGNMETSVEGHNVQIRIPFTNGAIVLHDTAQTAAVISNILMSEFGEKYNVTIEKTADAAERYSEYMSRQLSELNTRTKSIAEAEERRMAMAAAAPREEAPSEPEVKLPRVQSLFEGGDTVQSEEGSSVIVSGRMKFDIACPECVLGREFTPENIVPLRAVKSTGRDVEVVGEVFQITEKETRRGDKIAITIGITDKDASLFLKTTVDVESEIRMSRLEQSLAMATLKEREEQIKYLKGGSVILTDDTNCSMCGIKIQYNQVFYVTNDNLVFHAGCCPAGSKDIKSLDLVLH